jgi:hypothetical protein
MSNANLKMNMKVTVKKRKGLTGVNLFRFFDNGIRKRLPKGLADEFHQLLLKNIDENSFQFVLTPKWVADKQRRGADKRPFIEYGTYKQAIRVVSKDGHLSVGFIRVLHPRAKMTVAKLARLLEFGDLARNIPARPLWRNTTRQFQREVMSRARFKQHLKNALDGTGQYSGR